MKNEKSVMIKRLVCNMLFLFCAIQMMHSQEKEYKAYLVATAHFDTQWNWDVRESIDDYLHRTMVQNFWLFERFPNYIFNFESAQKYAWMKEYYPHEYELVKKYIKAGRWNVVGSAWEATDPNIPSSESFFRNVLLGQEFYKKEFGVKSNDIYLPDCFGFGYTLPTIAAHCGLIGFSTQKLQWRKNPYFGEKEKMPFKIGLWRGLDGAGIMAVLDAGGYGTSYYYDDITTNRRILERAKSGPNNTAYSYYGVGDRGGSPTLPSVYSLEKSLKANGPLEIISAKAGQIYEDYYPFEKHPELPVYDGELLMDVHGVGCYTSQAAMKHFNRRNEHLADAAERASSVAEILGGLEYPSDALRENWQRFLWHQFHDDLTGTSIPQSYTFSWNDELIAQTRFAETITTAVGAVSRALNTNVKGMPVVVYNPVASSRRDVVKATVKMEKRPSGIKVISQKGEDMPAQVVSWGNGMAEILFVAQVDPLSFSVYSIQPAAATSSKNLRVKSQTIENAIYRITLDAHGDIASIFDKKNNRELVQAGKPFRLMMFTENLSTDYPAWEIYKKVLDGPSTSITDNVNISVAENGPLRASLRVERTAGDSKFVQYIALTDGAEDDRIEISNEIDWQGKKVLLKAEFPTTVSNEKAAYDLGLGYIKRGNNVENSFEVLGHQWADLTANDSSYGISILNDSKYGWDKPDNNTIRLTLLHTPQPGKHYTYQDHQDHGHHAFRYAIVGHQSDAVQADIAWKAENFNQPLLAFTATKHAGKLGRSYSFATTDRPQIALKAIKKAEDGKGYIVRINEIYGTPYEQGYVEFASDIESAKEMNGIEEEIGEATFSGNKLMVSGTAFQPRTFKIAFKQKPLLSIPNNQPLDLAYNAVALTSDEFNRAGNFDRQGNSMAAELMPEKILSDGVEFKMQNDPAVFNYIRANGDTIFLPEHHGANKLFLLVTSVKDDRQATFLVDGKPYQFNVPYYSGFYGQWGWKGESEGYIKDASIGYIANHKHSERKGNDSYSFAYLYKLCLDIPVNARMLVLPEDAGIAVFAATLTDNQNYDVKPVTEMRVLPYQTKEIEYTSESVPFYQERGAW
ncbi:alpha-mannosidase [Bacteroides sp.]|uniref:alpha-mannosidase n=1 Tax=Bacteroides sp. TaxID=29523 RepID=UPI003A922040